MSTKYKSSNPKDSEKGTEDADYRLRLSAGMIVVLIPRGAALPRGDA